MAQHTQAERIEALEQEGRLLQRDLRDARQNEAIAKGIANDLQNRLTASELRGQEVAQKWREKNQALLTELQMAQVGLTSGCGCPIGQCVRKKEDEGSCWMQWAEAHVLQRMVNMRISELQRHGNHPSRFAAVRAEGVQVPRLGKPEPEGTPPPPDRSRG